MWLVALGNVLAFLFRTCLSWLLLHFSRLFSIFFTFILSALSSLTIGHITILFIFISFVGLGIGSLIDMANKYLYDLLNTGSFSSEIWLCFMSLLPVNLPRYITIIITTQIAVLGFHFMYIYSRELLRITSSPFSLPFIKK
ncbi:hypothetical protein JZC40_004587 [Salmonella enterica subsp. enterica serovar Moero]|nr:hypothetical protein [Salmonella enterica subsp. enterica serovar Lattenkamp]EHG3460828.1 hypothetical protein [Salmonella enterica subsp. enterica serovar Moero]